MSQPNDSDQIEAGREAWARIKDHGRRSFDDWITLAKALAIGRAVALAEAGCEKPYGVTFTKASARWLRQTGLYEVNEQERSRALLIHQHLPEIMVWRAGLTEAQRRRNNHPNAIWAHWRRSITVAETAAQQRHDDTAKPAPQRKPVVTAAAPAEPAPSRKDVPRSFHSKPRAIFWSQAAMKRAFEALRLSKSNDLMTLARVALEAAIRTESDLLELLPDAQVKAQVKPKAKRQTTPTDAVVLQ